MPSISEITKRKKRNTSSRSIVLDPEIGDEITRLQVEYEQASARMDADPTNTAVRESFQRAENAVEEAIERAREAEAVVTFTFQAIPRDRYEELVAEHPPTADQVRKHKAEGGDGKLSYNLDTFAPALIAECSLDPEISLEEANAIWESDDWNQPELFALFFAAIDANQSRRTIELGKGFMPTGSSEKS